ncbi:hypothetical protein SAMN05192589_12718 [Paracidovorax valerianellae]|uniref:Uncharacterized protein n=1 Tax=Paracidovorax valerianellae TaxID=187868 RepID=A0A1G7F787_9BURK|nr:hypothetical protein SAMN05192589_12718 [Paracidovorax valerianellae]
MVMTDTNEQPKRLLIALLYPPTTFMTSPEVEALRSVARGVDISEATLECVPRVNTTFLIETRRYTCLRVQDAFVPEGFAAVVFAVKA